MCEVTNRKFKTKMPLLFCHANIYAWVKFALSSQNTSLSENANLYLKFEAVIKTGTKKLSLL